MAPAWEMDDCPQLSAPPCSAQKWLSCLKSSCQATDSFRTAIQQTATNSRPSCKKVLQARCSCSGREHWTAKIIIRFFPRSYCLSCNVKKGIILQVTISYFSALSNVGRPGLFSIFMKISQRYEAFSLYSLYISTEDARRHPTPNSATAYLVEMLQVWFLPQKNSIGKLKWQICNAVPQWCSSRQDS